MLFFGQDSGAARGIADLFLVDFELLEEGFLLGLRWRLLNGRFVPAPAADEQRAEKSQKT